MSDEPLTNAAVESVQLWFEFWNACETAPQTTASHEDFLYVDHRTGGFSFGEVGHSGVSAIMASVWDAAAPGQPHWSMRRVIAVRDQNAAVVEMVMDYGGHGESPELNGVVFDSKLESLRRMFSFDIEDRDAAIAELDRLHAEIDD